jgi:hypothetical protein
MLSAAERIHTQNDRRHCSNLPTTQARTDDLVQIEAPRSTEVRPRCCSLKRGLFGCSCCCLLWFLAAVVFAGVFGWAFHSWHDQQRLADQCTRLTVVTSEEDALVVFIEGTEYLLDKKDHPCYDFLKDRLPVLSDSRRRHLEDDFPSIFLIVTYSYFTERDGDGNVVPWYECKPDLGGLNREEFC